MMHQVDAVVGNSRIVKFPAGSDKGATNALPAVWEKPDQFRQRVKALEDAMPKLAAAVNCGDGVAIAGAMGKVVHDTTARFTRADREAIIA